MKAYHILTHGVILKLKPCYSETQLLQNSTTEETVRGKVEVPHAFHVSVDAGCRTYMLG